MPYCQLAYLSEKNGVPEEHALKLSILFNDPKDALRYIKQNIQQNNLAIHDACLFTLPDVSKCSFEEIWKDKIKTYINDPNFRQLLVKLPELEQLFKSQSEGESTKLDRAALKVLKQEISNKNKRFKFLKRKHGQLNDAEDKEYTQIIPELSDMKKELFKKSRGLPLKEMDLLTLRACNEYYICNQGDVIYSYMIKQGLTKRNYEEFRKLDRNKAGESIPGVTISGTDIGHTDSYLRKLDVANNETDAAIAACLGKLTNCCQSLSGEMGEPCVIHGLTSPNGGFYVLFNKKDEVVAQCWAWRSQANAIVFDSIETNRTGSKRDIVIKYFRLLAKKLIEKEHTHKVACGKTSGIPRNMGGIDDDIFKEHCIDYNGYCDSKDQMVLYDKSKPYLFYNTDSSMAEETLQNIQQVMENKESLLQSNFLCELINWILLQKEKDVTGLHSQLMEIAKKNKRYKELEEIIEINREFLKNESFEGLKKDFLFPSIRLESGNTALHLAIQNGDEQIIKLLLDKGANVNAVDNNGRTPLHEAVVQANEPIVQLLLENGANIPVNKKNKPIAKRLKNVADINTVGNKDKKTSRDECVDEGCLRPNDSHVMRTLIKEFKNQAEKNILNRNSLAYKNAMKIVSELCALNQDFFIEEKIDYERYKSQALNVIKQNRKVLDQYQDYDSTQILSNLIIPITTLGIGHLINKASTGDFLFLGQAYQNPAIT